MAREAVAMETLAAKATSTSVGGRPCPPGPCELPASVRIRFPIARVYREERLVRDDELGERAARGAQVTAWRSARRTLRDYVMIARRASRWASRSMPPHDIVEAARHRPRFAVRYGIVPISSATFFFAGLAGMAKYTL